ncbi:hypothetical protein IHQ68_04510 [Chelatococcus sambhunathii]|uniref:Uncharacterized protein n=1 Tax=Chelatococcus sambhunathii TaxID=363953 RepID=A0ABU1DCQ6_9HYPH|nr:hypothetical protein [Chelatococcus sambhunathii]MDR4305888.1 hypothetical protein [Chelatococcus sambhunathii]
MLGYEETGYVLGMGDLVRKERALAQQVVDQVVADRDAWARVALQNKEFGEQQASIAHRNFAIAEQNRRVAEEAQAEVRRLLAEAAAEKAAREAAERYAAALRERFAEVLRADAVLLEVADRLQRADLH